MGALCYICIMQRNTSLREDLVWQVEAGIDECIGDAPVDRFSETATKLAERAVRQPAPQSSVSRTPTSGRSRTPEAIAQRQMPVPPARENSAPERAVQSAVAAASAAKTIDELSAAVDAFEGCSLKKTAMNTVFADGNPAARIMFVGEVPGADEDRKGLPFMGASGVFLERMLASIELDRSSYYITNIVFWRPPGDRKPTASEIAACLPFVERHIELVDPEILVLLGGPASKALLGMNEGIAKIHGQWFDYASANMASPVRAMPLYHPENLLKSPAQKRDAWHDLLEIKQKLAKEAAT